MPKSVTLVLLCCCACCLGSLALANGNGAGAGGAGHQRAINSGLPPGDPGPAGAPNNRRQPPPAPAGLHGSPRPEPAH